MGEQVVVAYIPVLHEGYWRFLDAHGRGRRAFVVGPMLYDDYRPLAKDVRRLDAGLIAASIDAWQICSQVAVLDREGAARLADESPTITLPAGDVSYQVVDRFFSRCEVLYDSVFLRWDKSKSVQLLRPEARDSVTFDEAVDQLVPAAELAAAKSIDWWRQVGAAIRFADGQIATASNEHNPPLGAYIAGDPRSNFFKGVHVELSTATHAEARLIAQAARDGRSTEGAAMYVTDFPCPPCAKLIAAAGVSKLYFRSGYAVLDGEAVLTAAGVEIVRVQ